MVVTGSSAVTGNVDEPTKPFCGGDGGSPRLCVIVSSCETSSVVEPASSSASHLWTSAGDAAMLRCARLDRHADGLLLGWLEFTECQLSQDPETMAHCRGEAASSGAALSRSVAGGGGRLLLVALLLLPPAAGLSDARRPPTRPDNAASLWPLVDCLAAGFVSADSFAANMSVDDRQSRVCVAVPTRIPVPVPQPFVRRVHVVLCEALLNDLANVKRNAAAKKRAAAAVKRRRSVMEAERHDRGPLAECGRAA
ncbi:unnamed protein product [Lampetra planeri]